MPRAAAFAAALPFRTANLFPCRAAEIGFVAAWEAQSQISTMVLVGLTAFASPLSALAVIVTWSLAATVIYARARGRERGLPDLLDRPLNATPSRRVAAYALFLPRSLLAGLQPMVYAQTAGRLLDGRAAGSGRLRWLVVGAGLVLFGVTPAEHLARRAGLRGATLLRVCLLGPFLNVPYRVFLSGLVIQALRGLA